MLVSPGYLLLSYDEQQADLSSYPFRVIEFSE